MSTLLDGVFHYWVPLGGVCALLVMWAGALHDIASHPEKKRGYVILLIWAFLLFSPIFYEGIATLIGSWIADFESPESPTRRATATVVHLAWAFIALAAIVTVWFRGGIQFLHVHDAMFTQPKGNLFALKLWAGLLTVVLVVGVSYVLLSDFNLI